MTPIEGFHGEAAEVLRCTSVALSGSPVTVWEATRGDHLELQPLGGSRNGVNGNAVIELETTLSGWRVPVHRGNRWVASRLKAGGWLVAPVRTRPPDPPPGGMERRSPQRLTLELAGLCLGLLDRRARTRASASALQDLAGLPAMIAHEAGNPLAAARAGLQLALETLGAQEIEPDRRVEMLQDLGQVLEDIDRAVAFLRAVQDRARGAFSRVERFDAVRAVRSCLTLERRLLQDRRVTLNFDADIDSAYLTGDPGSLFEIVVNLVRNAADAYEGQSGVVDVRLTREGSHLHLEVVDRGHGIAPENLPLVFEAGFTTKEFGKGSGMGLALVRSVVQEVFSGAVDVDSTPDRGTTFTVTLPVPPQRSPGASVSAAV